MVHTNKYMRPSTQNLSVSLKFSEWIDRAVLLLVFAFVSLIWGVSWTRVESIEKLLNSPLLMVVWIEIFIGLLLFWVRTRIRQGYFNTFSDFFVRYQQWIIVLFFLSYLIIMTSVSILRHLAFQTHAFDLAIFDQAVWSTLKGKILFSSFKGNICLLGDHMSPILILLAPFYWFWNDARILLLIQACVASLCFFPLSLITQEKLGKGIFPVLFAFALYFYQPFRHSVRAEFHPELIANSILFFAFYFLIKKNWTAFFISLILSVLCKENMYGITFMLGIYLCLEKRFRAGLAVVVMSLFAFLLTTKVLIPHLSGSHYFYGANYQYLISGSWGSHAPLIVQPASLFEYIYKIFLPLAFLSFFHAQTLILTFPILFQNILSRNPTMHSMAFQYTSGLTPFVFISAVFGTWELLMWGGKSGNEKWLRPIIIISILVFSLILAGKPERRYFYNFKRGIDSHTNLIRETIKKIPEYLSVVTNENLAPHLSHRFQIGQFEDYQRALYGTTYAFINVDLVILDRRFTQGDFDKEIGKVKASGYQIISEREDLIILKRRSEPETLVSQQGG